MFGNSRFTRDSTSSFSSLQSHGSFWEEQRSSSSRPSGKTIYLQRKEYAESMNRQPDNFQYRVQHLFTLEMDGQQVRGVDDCVARLKQLDARGRVWAQDMILEARGVYLQLSDIETKEELETLPLARISDIQAVLDSCTYNSLLMVAVQEGSRSKVFMFQCEEVGAENIRDDLKSTIQHRKGEASNQLQRNQHSIRSDLENILGQEVRRSFRNTEPPPMQPERYVPPPEQPPPQRNDPDREQRLPFAPQEDPRRGREASPLPPYTETDRSVEIFNHIVADLELFMEKVSAAIPMQVKGKKSKQKKGKGAVAMPPTDEFISCLEKIKYGFNIMGKVNGQISNPSAAEFVHILFSTLSFVVSHCPPDLPPSVLIPLLTESTLRLMAQEVTPEEDQLWQSLGDAWNIPRSKWPDGDLLPPYVPEFYDGWRPPSPVQALPNERFVSRSSSQRNQPEQNYGPWDKPPSRSNGPSIYMRVMYDFMARNPQELSVMKGEMVQVLDQSRQWWLVRNNSNQEGHVPHNLLEPLEGDRPPEQPAPRPSTGHQSPPSINMMSSPNDVKAWLEYKGFSQITVRSLGTLTGALLLGMTRDELRAVCPEEGGRVFFHLQGVKSALAVTALKLNQWTMFLKDTNGPLASENGFEAYRGR
ncbi:epidermal growth factor receptor kinase substrate 8-like protein 3b [Scleropages formosus]|uniref:epidermal growth factor receptor kinase substrate 8-like protein 3b n=1 Tax=Scleropages formosus TaxID=113540 RepID=UPI0010FA9985|nr:epidermal growth factor receptor kinase substrate 8-like protein 3 [Scleropages formosus]